MPHEFDGEQYRRASAHQKEWGARLIEELKLTGDERVLDLGCGDGALTARIAALAPRGRALGIDASAGMIASARRLSAPNLEFRLLDINDLRCEAEFDVVFSNATLHWVRDHRPVLAGIRRGLFHVEVSRQSAYDPVIECGGGECLLHPLSQVEDLIHAFLEKSINQDRHNPTLLYYPTAGA
jgi:SAM-dependent methyltransferase